MAIEWTGLGPGLLLRLDRDPRGSAAPRDVVAACLRRVRRAAADPDQVVVCTGSAQGLNLVLRALAHEGVRAAIGFGNVTESAIRSGIATVGDLLPGWLSPVSCRGTAGAGTRSPRAAGHGTPDRMPDRAPAPAVCR